MVLPDLDNIPESGAVFTIGRSRFADNVASHFFIRQDPVVTIACGDEHSAVVCQSGRLFVFGSNDWGQLGLGHKNHVSKPSCVKILKPEKVTHIACGRAHSLICTGGQKIFACGRDQEGQLGRGDQAGVGGSTSSPVLVYDCGLIDAEVVQVAAGSHHSMALTSDGNVVAWGSNSEGQLGLPDKSGPVTMPTVVQLPEPIKAISVGYYHSAFLTESGLVYVCGESENGKLGIVTNFATQNTPLQLQLPAPALAVACGGHHTIIETANGTLHSFGSNFQGQLGLGQDVTEAREPKTLNSTALQGESVSKISCGESHTAIITESGKLFTCGDGRHGKLGLEENENNVHELTLASRYEELVIMNVACGGCHTILVARRREDDRDKSDADPVVQTKNSLPPLKLPLARITNENGDLDNATNALEQKGIILDMENSKDRMNNVEKPEAPKSLSEYIEEATEEKVEVSDTKNNNAGENENLNGSPSIHNPEIDESQSSLDNSEPIEIQKSPDKFYPPSLKSQTQNVKTTEVLPSPPPKPPRQKQYVQEKPQISPKKSPEIPIPSTLEEGIKEKDGAIIDGAMNSQQLEADSNSRTEMSEKLDDGSTLPETEKEETGATRIESETKQLPAAIKTGKMAKLFKGKKDQEAEIKPGGIGAPSSKSKSKTCTVL